MSEETFAYCQNSRRWLLFMDMLGKYPFTCPYNGECHRCGYFEERKATKYLLQKKKFMGFQEEKKSVSP